eukprot:TRINITY_DN32393_c0_g1_i1.p1 TRINITY_DN32393_c0_g1~~TRINITY_DN32393_c0_g1_i1.p1  ORF type:complete len:407 (+),score=101.30 TRINITY_DN32393_c0_g1_i1:69-1289(+)
MAPPVLVRATFLRNDAKQELQALVPAGATVGGLKAALVKQLREVEDVRLVFRGVELADGGASLEASELLPTADRPVPHVYLCKKVALAPAAPNAAAPAAPAQAQLPVRDILAAVPAALSTAAAAATNAVAAGAAPPLPDDPPPPAAPEPAAPTEPPCCRLCFDSEETVETGKLFSPCLCAGTMQHIHVQCLNNWRMKSQNAASYYRCDQCGYEYNVTRANWASYLANPRLITLTAVVWLIVGTLLCGSIIASCAPVPLHEHVWELVQFNPLAFLARKACRTEDCDARCNTWNVWTWREDCWGCACALEPTELQESALATLTDGVVPIALYGLWTRRSDLARHWYNAVWLICAVVSAPQQYGRFLLVLGVVAAYYVLLQAVALRAKIVMTRWGEHIMSVKRNKVKTD